MSEENVIMKAKKSRMAIYGDLFKLPWILLFFIILIFWAIGLNSGNFNGVYAGFAMYGLLLPFKYVLNRQKTYTITSQRLLVSRGKADPHHEMLLKDIDYVNIEYPVFGKTLNYGHVKVTYNYNRVMMYKDLKDPFKFAETLNETFRYAKAQFLKT